MSEKNKALSRRFYQEVWGKRNLDALDQLVAADVVDHDLPPGFPPGRKGTKAYLSVFLNAFPDSQMTIEDQVAEEDKVVTRWTITGTHTGELMGIPATGRQGTTTGIYVHRIASGQIVETWGEFDEMGMMRQIGVIPTPG